MGRLGVLTPSALVVSVAFVLVGCQALSDRRAEALVRKYDEKLIEAFRVGDERVIEGLVGDEEAKKIVGLIGVKYDMGLTLDAVMTQFVVLGFQRPSRDWVDVLTEERWHYQDRRIGTGAVVGEKSDDHYFMRYVLKKQGKAWVVSKVSFERPPEVGRRSAPNQAPPKVFHGMQPKDDAAGSAGGRSSSERKGTP